MVIFKLNPPDFNAPLVGESLIKSCFAVKSKHLEKYELQKQREEALKAKVKKIKNKTPKKDNSELRAKTPSPRKSPRTKATTARDDLEAQTVKKKPKTFEVGIESPKITMLRKANKFDDGEMSPRSPPKEKNPNKPFIIVDGLEEEDISDSRWRDLKQSLKAKVMNKLHR